MHSRLLRGLGKAIDLFALYHFSLGLATFNERITPTKILSVSLVDFLSLFFNYFVFAMERNNFVDNFSRLALMKCSNCRESKILYWR